MTTHGQGGRNGSACCEWDSEAPHPAECSRERPGHAELLRARAELVRLDAGGNELRVPGDGDEANPGPRGERPELAEEVERVRLVARPLPPENVRIEGHDLHARSRQIATTASAARSQVNSRARARPGRNELVPARGSLVDARRDRRRVQGIDEDSCVARDFLHRGLAGRDDGRPARHRLEHREAETLVQRRVHDAARAAVERRELGVGHLAHPPGYVHASPPARAHDTQLDAGLAGGVDGACEVLTRLERRDREHVVAIRARAVRREEHVDSVRNDPDALRGYVRERGHLASRELGHRDDRIGGLQHPLEPRAPIEAVPARKRLGCAQDREVVHRDDRGHGEADRAPERRAVEDVQPTRPPPQTERVPDAVPNDTRDPSGSPERQELELDPGSVAQRTQEPANDARGSRTRLDERRRVDADSHGASAPARSASRAVSYFMRSRASSMLHQR